MKEIYNLCISEDEIKHITNVCNRIEDEDVLNIKDLLFKLSCSENQMLNIIVSNPLIFNKSIKDIYELVIFLTKLGFKNLNILFDSNPYILNLNVDNIEKYIYKKIKKGQEIDNIINELESKPYLFNEL